MAARMVANRELFGSFVARIYTVHACDDISGEEECVNVAHDQVPCCVVPLRVCGSSLQSGISRDG